MTDNKSFLKHLFDNIKLLKPGSSHYSLNPAPTPTAGAILVISNEILDEEETQQTDKILQACKLDLDTRVVLTATAFKEGQVPVSKTNYFFLFGTGPSELGFNFELPVNRMVNLNGTCWIKTLPVKTLIKNQEAKSDLWKNGLQPHFQG